MIRKILSAILLFASIYANAQNQIFDVDVKSSSISWLGKKVTGQHDGNVQLKSGFIGLKNGKLEAGKFEIDMSSITCKDITDPAKNADLVNHLKNDDFFSVDKYPTAVLTITRIVPKNDVAKGLPHYNCFGNLSIKGKNNAVEFPAVIEVSGKSLSAKAKFSIDRTKWDISYKSGTVFPALTDKAIADNIEFEVNLKGSAK